MANRQFFYFYAPTWDYPPGGPIKLGNVITSVKKPQRPLFCSPPAEDSDVFRTEKRSVQYTKEKLRRGKFSILIKFLNVLGFGVDIGAEIDWSDEETFVFETLETTQFILTPSYLQTCIDAGNSRTVGGTFGVEADATVWTAGALPIGGGPRVEGKLGNNVSIEWEGSSDFVFAFRVSKVWVGEATGQVVREEEECKGAMFGREREEEVKGPELAVLKVEELDTQVEGFDVEELMNDEEVVLCAIPREEDSDLDD